MISRTYPAEWTTFSGTEYIISEIRGLIGDRPELKRYMVTTDTWNTYIFPDNHTFYQLSNKFWPYHLVANAVTCSGESTAQVLNYHYVYFNDELDNTLLQDYWIQTFYLSDYEIWSAYLAVDLSPFVRYEECITEEMDILKAAIDLMPTIRQLNMLDFYGDKEVIDDDTTYRKRGSAKDPYKDRIKSLESELQTLIDNCNKRPYFGGIRVE